MVKTSLHRILVGVAASFASAMLAVTGYTAVDSAKGRDLTDVERTEGLATEIERIQTEVDGNLMRARALAEATKQAHEHADAVTLCAFTEQVPEEPEEPLEPGEPPEPEEPEEPEETPPRPAVPMLYTGGVVQGLAIGPGGSMAVIDGDVYRTGDWFNGMKVVGIHESGVFLETPEGDPRKMNLTERSQKRNQR